MKRSIHYLHLLFVLVVLLLAPSLANASLKPIESNFLVFNDIHLDQSDWLPMTINPSIPNPLNDLDQGRFETMLSLINTNIKNGIVPKPQFILILGDISGHARVIPDSAIKNESVVFSKLKAHFEHTPIFYIFGNNDSLKANYGPFYDRTLSGRDKSPYDVAISHSGWLDGFLSTGAHCKPKHSRYPCLISEDPVNGYYSAYLHNKLRLIALNSVLFAEIRGPITKNAETDQLQWLSAQLESAKINHESVLIAMHIPPGNNAYDHSSFWFPREQANFLKSVKIYRHTIIGLLAAHTHAEELKVIKASPHQIIGGLYITAALSTSHGNAPAIKTFYFSKRNGQWLLSNYQTFNFLQTNGKLTLNKLYDYQRYYCNHHETNVTACLDQISIAKMKKYYSAGNPNFDGIIGSPNDISAVIEWAKRTQWLCFEPLCSLFLYYVYNNHIG